MASEKVARILRSKSPFSKDEISSMSDAEGWAWVYENGAPKKEKLPMICFSGFSDDEKALLASRAATARFGVATAVTKTLKFLCIGNEPGPMKVKKAQEQGVTILNRAQFEMLIETGELPIGPQ